MRHISVVLLVVMSLAACRLVPEAAASPAVVSLKPFLKCPCWQLDVTYSAKDSDEDSNFIYQLEMKAVARYYLEQLDRGEAWGHWQALKVQSFNHTWRAFRQNKTTGARGDYCEKQSSEMVAPLADLQIGRGTPGYMLIVNGGFPGQLRDATVGLIDHPLVLGSTEKNMPGLQGVASGPLPEKGVVISGSRVIPFEIPPFCLDSPRMTRMGVEYVLRPDERLAPLTR